MTIILLSVPFINKTLLRNKIAGHLLVRVAELDLSTYLNIDIFKPFLNFLILELLILKEFILPFLLQATAVLL